MADRAEVESLIAPEQIQARVVALGREITEAYRDKNLVVLCILKGSFVFTADLVRSITLPLRLEFLGVKSYGDSTRSSGVVQITQDLAHPIDGADVLIVEDIVDTGLTLGYLMDQLETRGPRSVSVCALLHKPARTLREVPIDYLGFTIEDVFVVGYGLDCAEKYRNLPSVCRLNET